MAKKNYNILGDENSKLLHKNKLKYKMKVRILTESEKVIFRPMR